MKIPRLSHSWSLTPRQAIALQKKMARLVSRIRPRRDLRFIAGLDAAFSADDELCFAAVVLWDRRERLVVEQQTAAHRLIFPYIPGLLSFREIPALLSALRKLKRTPDALMCDGQGLAHPRRFGIACHLGVICQLPAIGCAKSRLVGDHTEPALARGSQTPLTDKGEVIGTVLRTQLGVKPVYVSIGHKIDLLTAKQMVLDCAVRYRLPEPTRLADRLVAAAKRAWVGGAGR
jgi:deoxyribonuclease V